MDYTPEQIKEMIARSQSEEPDRVAGRLEMGPPGKLEELPPPTNARVHLDPWDEDLPSKKHKRTPEEMDVLIESVKERHPPSDVPKYLPPQEVQAVKEFQETHLNSVSDAEALRLIRIERARRSWVYRNEKHTVMLAGSALGALGGAVLGAVYGAKAHAIARVVGGI